MSMLSSVSFAEAPFSAEGFSPDAKVQLQGQSLTVTLSNTYSVQKTHFVNGFNLSLTQGTIEPIVIPQEANFSTTVTSVSYTHLTLPTRTRV